MTIATATETTSNTPAYRPEIDGLRTIAIAAVLCSHWIPGFAYLFNWGVVGVYVFFVISGYVITLGLLQEDRIDISSFFVRRIARIWPIYFLTIACIYFFGNGFASGSLPWHALFLSNILSSIKGEVISPPHFWTLSVEQQFYLIWPFVILGFRKNLKWICAAMILVSPISRWCFSEFGNLPSAFYSTSSNLDCLAAGALMAMMDGRLKSFIPFSLTVSVLLLAFCLAMSYFGNATWINVFAGTATAGITTWVITMKPSKILTNSVMIYIGKISYGIYMYHLFVGSYVSAMIGDHGTFVFATISTISSIAIAIISWHIIEKPAMKLIRPSTTRPPSYLQAG